MLNFIARIISIVFNPLIVLFPIPYVLVYKTTYDIDYSIQWALISYIFMALVAIFVFSGVLMGYFTDFDVSKRQQRSSLFLFSFITTIIYVVMLFLLKGPEVLFVAIGGMILGLVILAIINRRLKASIHVATISAVISAVGLIYGGPFLLAFSLIPLIAWSRVKTKRHTSLEAVVGGIVGTFLTIIIYIVVKKII